MPTSKAKNGRKAKEKIRLREWSEQIRRQQNSGLSVKQWCVENGINPKTYYYRQKKVEENCIESKPSIVPITMTEKGRNILIEKNGITITLPCETATETLIALVRELC